MKMAYEFLRNRPQPVTLEYLCYKKGVNIRVGVLWLVDTTNHDPKFNPFQNALCENWVDDVNVPFLPFRFVLSW